MTNRSLNLEQQVHAAQSILSTPSAAEAERLEWALAAVCRAVAPAMALREPSSRAGACDMDLNQVTLLSGDVARGAAFYRKLGLLQIVEDLPNYVRFEMPNGSSTLSLHY